MASPADNNNTDSTNGKNGPKASLSEREIAEIRRAFQALEVNDNMILTKDLGNVLRSLGQNLSSLEILDKSNELDENGDGKIHFDQFLKVLGPKFREITISEEIKEAFRVFDKDGNGTVSLQEFQAVLSVAVPDMRKKEMDEMLQDMDANHDGTLDYQEFVDLMGPVMDSN